MPEAKLAIKDYKIGPHLNKNMTKSLTDVADYLYAQGKIKKKIDWEKLGRRKIHEGGRSQTRGRILADRPRAGWFGARLSPLGMPDLTWLF